MNISGKLAQCNGRLKSARVGVLIEQDGGRLRLRATLPPKPGSNRVKNYQQRIPISHPANLNGLKRAENEARKIGALLATGEFSWTTYIQPSNSTPQTCSDWIEKFKVHYFENGGTETTWTGDYWKAFKRLPLDAMFEPSILEAVILGTKANQRNRARVHMAISALAKFAQLDCDFSKLRGNYRPCKAQQRDIPDDQAIAFHREQLENRGWKWVYSMMACYGLRNHECFHLDLSHFPIIRVLETTKTGSREVWPCYPEWAERWSLHDRVLPPIRLDRTNEQIGHSVTAYLSPHLPFVPYDLRHAWAIRTSLFGWPVELAARQMGHSVDLHVKTYHRWINREHQQQVYELLVNRSDRPQPPQI